MRFHQAGNVLITRRLSPRPRSTDTSIRKRSWKPGVSPYYPARDVASSYVRADQFRAHIFTTAFALPQLNKLAACPLQNTTTDFLSTNPAKTIPNLVTPLRQHLYESIQLCSSLTALEYQQIGEVPWVRTVARGYRDGKPATHDCQRPVYETRSRGQFIANHRTLLHLVLESTIKH